MKLLSVAILVITCSLSAGFCYISSRPNRPTTPWSYRQPRCPATSLHAVVDSKDSPSADALLKMVEEMSNHQFSPEVMSQMSDLEKALTSFLVDESKNKLKPSPRPPGIPPPLDALEDKPRVTISLQKAEEALQKLRQRLRQEEESLRIAEEALKESLEEEEVLEKAEEALQKSREAAEERKAEAIRRTEAAVASAENARRNEREAVEQFDEEREAVEQFDEDVERTTRGTIAINKPRPTISLSSFLYGSKADKAGPGDKNSAAPSVSTSDVPDGIPILYNWVQYIDGSITGRVKGAIRFKDGATLSTSPVPNGAKGGSIITTESGSK
jgi:hypothetical protein